MHSGFSPERQVQLRNVKERDIDLLVVEELASSRDFRDWFARRTSVPTPGMLSRVSHSVFEGGHGESDLEVLFEHKGRRVLLLVENKIDAAFQPLQPERYRARARDYLSRGVAHEVRTVLLAPEAYGGGAEFDLIVRHEEIRAWFAELAGADPRAAYKLRILDAAISRGEKGWTLVPDQWATDFWSMYWKIAHSLAPDLRMPEPAKKPATSGFVRFKPVGLPKGVELIHKFPYGFVDLQFSGAGRRVSEFVRRYEADLRPGMTIHLAAKSVAVRMHLEEIAFGATMETADRIVKEALKLAQELVAWHRTECASQAAT